MPTTFANTINGDEILAKRSQCDYAGNDIQTTYATKSELPTATSQLTNDSGFITSVAFPVTDVQVDGTSVVNANGVAEVDLSNYATTQALTNGLAAKQDVISDLATIRSGAALGATAVQQADLAPYATTSAMNAALADKQDTLTAGTNVSISNNVISATDTTYTAGTGIEISNNEISVETPVDIVAGPGIVVDNPDGNTLRVSTEADAETVLYDAGDSPSQTGPWQISEARTNFEWVDIVFGNDSTGSMKQVTRFAANSNYMKLHLPRYDEEPSYKWSTMTLSWAQRTASIKTNSVGRFTIASNGSVSVSTAAAQAPYLFQIVGIHRIANN